MANVIKIKRSTANSTPASLEFGELALYSNGATNKIYVGNSSNSVVTLFDSTAGSVSSFNTTLSGLTPSTSTTGAVTLSGTLGVANGGTGTNTTPTAGGIIFGKTASAYGSTNAGTAGQFLVSNGAGTPVWSSTISQDSGGGVILSGGTRGNFNLGSGGKTVGTPSNGDFWWNSSDNTLRFFPNSTSGGKTLAYTSDIPTVNDATLTIAVSGTGLSVNGSSTFTSNDADNTTITVTSNANSSNGSGTIVARDSSGNFSANTITASLNGNASTATNANTATNIAEGAANQLVYQTGSGATGFVPAPTGSSQILVTSVNLGTSSWIGTTGANSIVRQSTPTITSPNVTTSITTGSTDFSLVNTTATTINFGGAGTTIDIGAATGNTNIKNNLTVAGNATVTGDLVVQGNTVTINTSTLEVEDSLISLAKGNTADSIDIGFYGRYGSTATYAGLFRDATDSKFRLFTGLQGTEPTGTINIAGTGYTAGTLVANLEGNANTATTLQTARNINGTSFDGSAPITTANWGTARDITIGSTTRSVNGSNTYSWSLSDIGALSSSNTSTQDGYFGDIYLRDDSTPSHYLKLTHSANLTANRTLSLDLSAKDAVFTMNGNLTVSSNADVSGTNTGDQNLFSSIANSAGTVQFSAANTTDVIRFAGSGATSISFDVGTKTITVSSTDTNTTYTAGIGLSLSTTTFSLANSNVLSLHNLDTSGYVVRTAANTVAARSITSTDSTVSITNGDGISGNTVLSIANTTIDGGVY